jgi:hypothetical protein
MCMLCSRYKRAQLGRVGPAILAAILVVTSPVAIRAQQALAGDAVSIASPGILSLLPDTLGGRKASSDMKRVGVENIGEIVADKAAIYREYSVVSAVSREYPGSRIEVFETRNPFAALGLFQFNSGASKSTSKRLDIGSGGAQLDGELLFWKGNFFVRVLGTRDKPLSGTSAAREALARAIANAIVSASPPEMRPSLFDRLPANFPGASLIPDSSRYFLGPESLNVFVEHGRNLFQFAGDTEAVAARYAKVEGGNSATSQGKDPDQNKGNSNRPAAEGSTTLPMKLVIVECHTPEFATDEMARVTNYVSSLSEIEQQQIVFKRTGNYIVAAVNVVDREFAEGLINSVEYPYTVKWLRNPLWPTNDPFRPQKAAEMLLSTFGLIGLMILTVLVGGTIFGTSVFLKRRRRQQEVFSDAGGMLRLDIEPFLLGLPPKRSDE